MTTAEAARRRRLTELVRGRLCTATDALATIVAGYRLSHTIPLPADVLEQKEEQNETQK